MGDVQQLHKCSTLLEQIKQFAQTLHVRGEFFDFEKVSLT